MRRLVECVPNFSVGRDRAAVDAIAHAIGAVPGVKLLDVDPGVDTNRTVYTFVGTPEAVSDAALQGARSAAAIVDMARHTGAHPRMGALDVCPIVPISGVTVEECVEVARRLGRRIADELAIPVYFYERAATRPERQSLVAIRAGEYEGLARKLADPAWAPDCGPATFNPRLGATVVGVREFLIACNVNLNTRDRRLANQIALNIRENGRLKRDVSGAIVTDAEGRQLRVPGRLKAVRAIGWYIEQYRQAQVSINLLSFTTTPLHEVLETVRDEASRLGLVVTGSELVGMAPLEALTAAGRFYLQRQGKSSGVPERELVEMAVRSMGLDQLAPFEPERKIIEYAVKEPTPLLSLAVDRFMDEVSSDAPTPGGGSVAALAGSLGAALAAMVANLTVGKPGYETAWPSLSALAERAQGVKAALARAVDEDAQAFNDVLAAVRLSRATPDQQRAREAALATAYRRAAEVPLDTARRSVEALALAKEAAETGQTNSVSDAGVAALIALAAVEGALLNVRINLGSIPDADFGAACREEADALSARAARLCEETLARVRLVIG